MEWFVMKSYSPLKFIGFRGVCFDRVESWHKQVQLPFTEW